MATRNYFRQHEDDPDPLMVRVSRRVRFEEVDLLGMVWHGRYPSYFEDGRIAFGDMYGLTYHSYMENQVVAPIVQMHLDYKSPLRFDETFIIETALHWAEAARLNFSYTLFNSNKKIVASGYTVQLLTETDGTVLLLSPEWLEKFKMKWKEGDWPDS